MKQKIQDEVKEALRAGDQVKVGALRMLLASFINKEKANNQEPLTEDQMQEAVSSEVKKRREAIEAFEKGGKQDMADQEKRELEILQEYLPEQLSEEKIREFVKDAISQTGASGAQDMGKVMAALMPHTKGKADGAQVSAIVKELLG